RYGHNRKPSILLIVSWRKVIIGLTLLKRLQKLLQSQSDDNSFGSNISPGSYSCQFPLSVTI
ncbi:MAG: hypothetical protein WAQ29_03850, partial [Nitrososphaeraceae archaeon]